MTAGLSTETILLRLQSGGVLLVGKQLESQSVAIMLAPKICAYSKGCNRKRNERTKGKQNNWIRRLSIAI